MAHINLLPWREERRKEQLRQFLTLMGLTVVMVILITLAVHLQYNRMISAQQARNQYLKNEITAVEKQIREINNIAKEKKRLLARMEVIQQLQRDRPGIVHLFDQMVKVIPDGIYLNSLKQTGKKLKLDGIAQSNARVSAYMRNIDASPWLTKPQLDVIQKKGSNKKSDGRDFTLQAQQLAQPKTETNK